MKIFLEYKGGRNSIDVGVPSRGDCQFIKSRALLDSRMVSKEQVQGHARMTWK